MRPFNAFGLVFCNVSFAYRGNIRIFLIRRCLFLLSALNIFQLFSSDFWFYSCQIQRICQPLPDPILVLLRLFARTAQPPSFLSYIACKRFCQTFLRGMEELVCQLNLWRMELSKYRKVCQDVAGNQGLCNTLSSPHCRLQAHLGTSRYT